MARAVFYKIHPVHPEGHKIDKVVQAMERGAVVLYPTDTVYALGCDPRNKEAIDRLRTIKPEMARQPLTLLCSKLTEVSQYAYIEDGAFKLIKALTPGPYTFILKATRELPRLLLDPRRKTAGLRIPDYPICRALLERLGGPLTSTSAPLPFEYVPLDRFELFGEFEKLVDVIVDDGQPVSDMPSTIIDLTRPAHRIVREGRGMAALAPFIQ
jgi:tRNA threonylcarbamoyl adenosine modification protein (Sua5/YciO/YrdC/YwlC family)